MNEIKIEWIKTNSNGIGNHRHTPFYAFSRGNNLLYMGKSYDQPVSVRVAQNLAHHKLNVQGLSIWLGYVNYSKSTFTRLTEQIVLDAECLMIKTNLPSLNVQCKETYSGRSNFKVKTSGCPLIRRCVRCENNVVYKTCL
jgi:hypothetical protein